MASDSPLESARILIVDDEAANVALLETVLRRAGYRSLHTTEDSRTVPACIAYSWLANPALTVARHVGPVCDIWPLSTRSSAGGACMARS